MEFKLVVDQNTFDQAVTNLLTEVYVDEGYTDASQAESLFNAEAVRSRGTLITA